MAAITNIKTFTGNGQAGVWNDPLNWTNGVVPGAEDTALFTKSATLNGPVEVGTLMLIGAETMTINGAIKTDSTNTCESFMVCQQSAVTFNAGSTLADAGGFEVGVHAVGSVTVNGASATQAAASLNMVNLKVGQFAAAVGTLNVAGIVNVAGSEVIGVAGQGTMNVTGNGSETLRALQLGQVAGANGQVNLTGNAHVQVGSWIEIGTQVQGAPGGTGAVSLGAGTSLDCVSNITVGAGSSVSLSGGTLASTGGGEGIHLSQGSTVSGFGTIATPVHGLMDNGLLASAGGTLVVSGNLYGMGAVQIGAGSTLDLVSSRISVPSIAFMGAGGTLDLTTGVSGAFSIAGFAAGDTLVLNGIDHASWNPTLDTLNLSEHGQVLDRLTLSGVAANASFTVTPSIGGSIIALAPAHH